jgi:hypothetical protein
VQAEKAHIKMWLQRASRSASSRFHALQAALVELCFLTWRHYADKEALQQTIEGDACLLSFESTRLRNEARTERVEAEIERRRTCDMALEEEGALRIEIMQLKGALAVAESTSHSARSELLGRGLQAASQLADTAEVRAELERVLHAEAQAERRADFNLALVHKAESELAEVATEFAKVSTDLALVQKAESEMAEVVTESARSMLATQHREELAAELDTRRWEVKDLAAQNLALKTDLSALSNQMESLRMQNMAVGVHSSGSCSSSLSAELTSQLEQHRIEAEAMAAQNAALNAELGALLPSVREETALFITRQLRSINAEAVNSYILRSSGNWCGRTFFGAGALFSVWARAASSKAHKKRIRMVRCSQDTWYCAVLLHSTLVSWRQCARENWLIIWRWRTQGLALLRVIVGAWRLSVFEIRSAPGSRSATPTCTRPSYITMNEKARTPSQHSRLGRRSLPGSMPRGGSRQLVAARQPEAERKSPKRSRSQTQIVSHSTTSGRGIQERATRDRRKSSSSLRAADAPMAITSTALGQLSSFVRVLDLQKCPGKPGTSESDTASMETQRLCAGQVLTSPSQSFLSTP